MTEEEKWKQTAQDNLVIKLRHMRRMLRLTRNRLRDIQIDVDLYMEGINGLKAEALREGLDPTQEYTSYE